MTENKFDMAVITAVDGEGCLACSWDERDLKRFQQCYTRKK